MRSSLAGPAVLWIVDCLAAECRRPRRAGARPLARLTVAATAGLAFLLGCWALLTLGQPFDQGGPVGAFAPIAGLCLVFGYLLGPVYLVVPALGVLLVDSWLPLTATTSGHGMLHLVRDILLYGGAGALLRQHLARRRKPSATHRIGALLAVATGAVLVNMVPALLLFLHEGWLSLVDVPAAALAFLLGDLSGLLLTAPPALLLADRLLDRRASLDEPGLATRRDALVALALLAAAAAFGYLASAAFAGESGLSVAMTPALLPILAGAMLFGLAVGIGLFTLAAGLLIAVSAVAADPPSALSLQAVLIACGTATLVVGATTSDRRRLVARLGATLARRTRKLDARNASLVAVNAALRVAADTDHLTGLPNRRAFDHAFAHLLAQDQPAGAGGGFGLLLIDIDHFKRINDRHGHQVGDAALVHIARLLASALREGDLVARVGDEEFAVLCRVPDENQLHDLACRLRLAVRTTPLHTGATGGRLDLRVSIGGALVRPTDDADRLMLAADRALYAAKRSGRDRIAIGEPGQGLRPPASTEAAA